MTGRLCPITTPEPEGRVIDINMLLIERRLEADMARAIKASEPVKASIEWWEWKSEDLTPCDTERAS